MSTSSIAPVEERRRVYAPWFDGLIVRALGDRLTPALVEELRVAGLDLQQRLSPHYPSTLRVTCLQLIRRHLFAELTEEQAWLALGRAAVSGFLKTLVGQTFALVFRMLGPRAVMKRAGSAMSAASNYVSAQTFERAPFRWEVILEGCDLPPAYYRGLVSAAMEVSKVDALQVLLVSHDGERVVLSCTWAPVSKR